MISSATSRRFFMCFGISWCFAVPASASNEERVQPPPEGFSHAPHAMQEHMISAEIEPFPNQTSQAAAMLQRLGFRILHLGTTISVQAPESLWVSVFNVSFETRTRTSPAPGGLAATYRKGLTEGMTIPLDLQPLIAGVMFAEPPEFFQGQPAK